jgi:hypothetical protein
MSNQLAIATVTCVLQDLLEPAMDIVPGARVSTVRPDRLGKDGKMTRGVNIYLYRVTPNAQFRNVDMPMRNSDGGYLRAPIMAVDLHYLISAFGDETTLEPQILLGATVARMHEHSILHRNIIQQGMESSASIVEGSDLDEQRPKVKILMDNLSTEDLSKIWSVLFQTPYQLSSAYVLGPVFLHSDVQLEPRAGLVKETRVRSEPMGESD